MNRDNSASLVLAADFDGFVKCGEVDRWSHNELGIDLADRVTDKEQAVLVSDLWSFSDVHGGVQNSIGHTQLSPHSYPEHGGKFLKVITVLSRDTVVSSITNVRVIPFAHSGRRQLPLSPSHTHRLGYA